jgi:hypothetical protein
MNKRDKACPPQQQGRCRKKNSANSVTRAGKAMAKKNREPVECAGLRRFRVCEMALVRLRQIAQALGVTTFPCRDATADETAGLLSA